VERYDDNTGEFSLVVLVIQLANIIIWSLVSFILFIYFIAKKYEKASLIIPSSIIVYNIFIIVIMSAGQGSGWFLLLQWAATLFVLGYSLHLIWREKE